VGLVDVTTLLPLSANAEAGARTGHAGQETAHVGCRPGRRPTRGLVDVTTLPAPSTATQRWIVGQDRLPEKKLLERPR